MKWLSVKDEPPSKTYPILVWGPIMTFPVSVSWIEEGTYGEPGFFEENLEYQINQDSIEYWTRLPESPKAKI